MRWRTSRSINAAKKVLNLEEQVSVSLTRNLKMLHPTYVIIDVSVFFFIYYHFTLAIVRLHPAGVWLFKKSTIKTPEQ